MEKITAEQQKDKVLKRIREEEIQLAYMKQILETIGQFEGKKITKHIETYYKKFFPLSTVYLENRYGMFHLKIAPLDYPDIYFSALLAYESSSRFSEIGGHIYKKNIEEHNQCYLLNSQRLPRLREGLKHIKKLIRKRDRVIDLMNEIKEEAKKYEMEYDFDIDKK